MLRNFQTGQTGNSPTWGLVCIKTSSDRELSIGVSGGFSKFIITRKRRIKYARFSLKIE